MKKRYFSLRKLALLGAFSIYTLFAVASHAAPADEGPEQLSTCLDDLAQEVKGRHQSMERLYTVIAEKPVTFNAKYADQLYRGNVNRKEAILMMHGFLASPHEMRYMAKYFNDLGYTVYVPLITGFGYGADVANKVPHAYWEQAIEYDFARISRCYSKVHLMGFSLGGGLISNMLLNTMNIVNGRFPITRQTKVLSATLLSPYYKSAIPMGGLMNTVGDMFTDTVSPTTCYVITGNPDLEAAVFNPEDYDTYIPVKATTEILRFAFHLRVMTSPKKKIETPVFMAYSEYDHTMDWKEAQNFGIEHFPNLIMKAYPASQEVRHQIQGPSGQNDYNALFKQIAAFIKMHE